MNHLYNYSSLNFIINDIIKDFGQDEIAKTLNITTDQLKIVIERLVTSQNISDEEIRNSYEEICKRVALLVSRLKNKDTQLTILQEELISKDSLVESLKRENELLNKQLAEFRNKS